jgi:hypothetical protein
MRKIGDDLLFKLRPVATGNHGHFHNTEKVMQQPRHFGIKADLLSARVPSRSNTISFFTMLLLAEFRDFNPAVRSPARSLHPEGPKNTRSDRRRQDEYVALSDGVSGAAVFDLPHSLDAHQYTRQVGGADGKRRLSAQSPQPEVFTIKQSLAFHRGLRLHHGRHQTNRTFRKINAGHRLIDLECPWLSGLRVNVVPVIQAKRHVAVLLNLEHHNVAAQRVNRTSRRKTASPGFGVNHARWSATVPFVSARRRSASVVSGLRPA